MQASVAASPCVCYIFPFNLPENGRNTMGGLAAWRGGQCAWDVPKGPGSIPEQPQLDPPRRERMTVACIWASNPRVLLLFLVLTITMQGGYFIPFYRWEISVYKWLSNLPSVALLVRGKSSQVLAVLLLTLKHAVPCLFYSLNAWT